MTDWLTPDTILLGQDCPLPLTQPFTRAQAEAYGVSPRRLRTLVGRGLVRRVLQGVWAAAQAQDSIEFRAAALRLVLSPSAIATDRTAAWLLGVDILPRSGPDTVPPLTFHQRPGTRARRAGVQSGERRLRISDVMFVEGVAVTTPLRTALDLGRQLWRFDALGALDAFARSGVSPDAMLLEEPRFRGYRGVLQLRTLLPLVDGRAESIPESALRLWWYDAGLPKPHPQWWVNDERGVPRYRLDLAAPDLRYAAEYDGREHHTSAADRAYDDERRAWLRAHGWYIDVFVFGDLYGLHVDPIPRLLAGIHAARLAL